MKIFVNFTLLRTLTSIANGMANGKVSTMEEKTDQFPSNSSNREMKSVLLLIVNRGDCKSVRACYEACPIWANEARNAIENGVSVVSVGISWDNKGNAMYGGILPFSIDYEKTKVAVDMLLEKKRKRKSTL